MFTVAQDQKTTILFSSNLGNTFSTLNSFCSTTKNSYFDGINTVWLAQIGGHINKASLDLTTNIEGKIRKEDWSFYPNHNKSKGILNIDGLTTDLTEIQCFDITGILKLTYTIDQNHPEIELPELKPGNYILVAKNKSVAKW